MSQAPTPLRIVAQLLEAAQSLERWAETHRTATLAEHEQGCWGSFGRRWGRPWGRCSNAPWAGSAGRTGWRARQPVSVRGATPVQRPSYWCPACQRAGPRRKVLELASRQM